MKLDDNMPGLQDERSAMPERNGETCVRARPYAKYVLAVVLLAEVLASYGLRAGIWQDTGLNWLFWLLVVVTATLAVILAVSAARLVRSRMQFSIKTLLLVMLLTCAGLAGINALLQRTREQRRAVAALTALGAGIEYETGDQPGLSKLIGKQYFEQVVAVRCAPGTTGPALVHLEPLSGVRLLTLTSNAITDVDLIHFGKLNNLETVHIIGTRVTGSGLDHLRKLPSLCDLSLCGGTPVTNAGLAQLSQMERLVWLNLSMTKVGDGGLGHLSGLNRLKSLLLASTRVTDQGLVHLQGLRNLEELDLGSTRVSDAGLEHLTKLPKLKRLRLERCTISDEALGHFQRAMPGTITTR